MRAGLADERQLALDAEPRRRLAAPRSSGTRCSLRSRTSSSIVCSMLALSSYPSGCIPPVPSRTRSDVGSTSSTMLVVVADLERRLPADDVDQEVVSGLGRGARALGPHRQGAVLRPELVRAWRDRDARSLEHAPIGSRRGRRARASLLHREADRRELSQRSSTSSAWCRASREPACSRRPGRTPSRRDRHQDGGDVDEFTGTVEIVEQDAEAHRMVMKRQVQGGRRPGLCERRRRLRAHGRRRDDPHQRADHRQRRVDGRGRRLRRPGRADQGLQRQARHALTAWRRFRCERSARARCRATAGPRSRRTPTGPSSAETARTTTSAWSAATSSPRRCNPCR